MHKAPSTGSVWGRSNIHLQVPTTLLLCPTVLQQPTETAWLADSYPELVFRQA